MSLLESFMSFSDIYGYSPFKLPVLIICLFFSFFLFHFPSIFLLFLIYPYLDYIIFPYIFPSCLWSGGFGHGAELPSTMSKSTISISGQAAINSLGERLIELQNNPFYSENIINNSIGSRNQKNNDSNSAYKSKYVSQLNGSTSFKRDDIFAVFLLKIQGLCSYLNELKIIVSL